MPEFTAPIKATIIGVTVGVSLIGLLAAYFRRRRNKRPWRDLPDEEVVDVSDSRRMYVIPGSARQPFHNGDIPLMSQRRSISPQCLDVTASSRDNTIIAADDSISVASTITVRTHDMAKMGAHEICQYGLDNLQSAINYWEVAKGRLVHEDDFNEDEGFYSSSQDMALRTLLEGLLNSAYDMELLMTEYKNQMQSNVVVDTAVATLQEMNLRYEKERTRWRSVALSESSDDDSFVSAREVPDLSDIDEQQQAYQHLAFYEAGVLELKHGSVPCRTLRTQMVGCSSDTEFLAKLHCLRITFNEMFKDETIRNYFCDSGRQMIAGLLVHAEKDPVEFYSTFDDMIKFAEKEESWGMIEDELSGRGVKALTFYDIVLDFILMDAFDDLANPPSSVTAVVQNRWLSDRFKETALSTAAWSVLKAKRRMLKWQEGFNAHFYAVSEHVTPVLAWGFLGPDSDLKTLCMFFKDQVLGFLQDIFSFQHVRYTVVEQMSDDIMAVARRRTEIVSARLPALLS